MCDGPYYIKGMSKKKELNAIMVNDNKGEETIMHVNPIRNSNL